MRLPWRRGFVESAGWLADDILLAIGWILAPSATLRAHIAGADAPRPVQVRAFGLSRPDLVDRPHPVGQVMVLHLPPGTRGRALSGTLVIEGDGGKCVTSERALARVTGEPSTFVGARLGWLDRETRARVVAFLAETLNQPTSHRLQLAQSLRAIRDALREPLGVLASDSPQGAVQVDRIFRIDDRSFYIQSSVAASAGREPQVSLVSPEGHRSDVSQRAFHYRQREIDADGLPRQGFVVHVDLNGPSLLGAGWLVEHIRADGLLGESIGPRIVDDPDAARQAILTDLRFDDPFEPQLVRDHAFPALQRLQDAQKHSTEEPVVLQVGDVPRQPEVSIVVPLFERIDLLEHQLAHFVDDPEFGGVDLIYVLDSPELAETLRQTAIDLYTLYRVSFRLVLLPRHLGFGPATNAGVSFANGRILILLNSDVFPTRPGWVGQLQRFHDRTPQIGAIGPKLLFEDDTLQHAGMYFDRPAGSAVWMNKHYFKGFHRRLPAANVARRVPAVTGACLMIAKDLFVRLGELRACYVQGDYEDSDLCLRLSTAGYDNWYVPDVELYHLESQSYEWDEPRVRSAFYNGWLQDHFWSETIEKLMHRFSAEAAGASSAIPASAQIAGHILLPVQPVIGQRHRRPRCVGSLPSDPERP